MSPTSPVLVGLLIVAAVGLLVAARPWRWWWQAVAATTALALALVTGLVLVNDNFGYYRTWRDVAVGLGLGGTGAARVKTVAVHGTNVTVARGRVHLVRFDGPLSHISRTGLVYLPPQYGQARYRDVRFPVVMLFHGTPGNPQNWTGQLQIADVVNGMIAAREIGPMVLVMPTMNDGGQAQECLDSRLAADQTYLTRDVPADVARTYRVASSRAEWGLMGFSTGGYCAADVALRHEGMFGAAASMDGYYTPPTDLVPMDAAQQHANNPLLAATRLPALASPLTPVWVSAGTGDKGDFAAAQQFVRALRRVQDVPFVVQPRAGHNFYAWADVQQTALRWIWTQLAPPQLKLLFPTSTAQTTTIRPEDPRSEHRTHHTVVRAPAKIRRHPK